MNGQPTELRSIVTGKTLRVKLWRVISFRRYAVLLIRDAGDA